LNFYPEHYNISEKRFFSKEKITVERFFFIIRHGESLANSGFSDNPDSSLSPRGKAQAVSCASFLKTEISGNIKFLSSPFLRTIQTAEIITESFNAKFFLEPLLHEFFSETIFPQKYQAKSLKEIALANSKIDGSYTDEKWLPQYFETKEDILRRAVYLRNSLTKQFLSYPELKNIVLISHMATIAALVKSMCSIEVEKIDNCSVTKISFEKNRFKVEYLAKSVIQ